MKIFLDANVVAKPVTRTFLMYGGNFSGFNCVWSQTVEIEATRHMPRRALHPADIRHRYGSTLSPRGVIGNRFNATSPSDRQILADAEASGVAFLITEDVDDFSDADLTAISITAVNPDLFLFHELTAEGYRKTVELFARRFSSPSRTLDEVHQSIGRQHPLTYSRFRNLFSPADELSVRSPKTLLRGPLPKGWSPPAELV